MRWSAPPRSSVRRFEHQVSKGTRLDALERAKRARTLGSLVSNVSSVTITDCRADGVLNEFGVNITPVLTGAGIAGLAVGFGAQTWSATSSAGSS